MLKTIYINHGDEDACRGLKEELDLHFKNIDVIIAKYNEKYKL